MQTYQKNAGSEEELELEVQEQRTAHHMSGVQPRSLLYEWSEVLGKAEDDPQDTADDPKGDFAARVPRKDTTSKIDGHDPADHAAIEKEQAEPVYLFQLFR